MKIFKSNPIQFFLILGVAIFAQIANANNLSKDCTHDFKEKVNARYNVGTKDSIQVECLNNQHILIEYKDPWGSTNYMVTDNKDLESQTIRSFDGYVKINSDLYKFKDIFQNPSWFEHDTKTYVVYYNKKTAKFTKQNVRDVDVYGNVYKLDSYQGSGWFGDDKNGEKFGLLWLKGDNGKMAFMNTQGDILSDFEFDEMKVTTDERGYHTAYKDGYWVFLDRNSFKQALPTQYEEADTFWGGKAKVKLKSDDKYPLRVEIDNTGKILTPRYNLADFRKKLEQGDDVYYKTNDDSGKGMIFEIKGNLVQVQTKESQCSQRDYRGSCQNYIDNQVGKWVKKSEVYPTNHFD